MNKNTNTNNEKDIEKESCGGNCSCGGKCGANCKCKNEGHKGDSSSESN